MKASPAQLLAICVALCAVAPTRAANLVPNGSFEELNPHSPLHWNHSGIGVEWRLPAPDGTVQVILYNSIWCDVPTEPGSNYYLSFAFRSSTLPTVQFGGATPALQAQLPLTFLYYNRAFAYVTATGQFTRLTFTGDGTGQFMLDDVRLISVMNPIEITTQPLSQEVTAGGTAFFSVNAQGGPPIAYTWQREGTPIPGATNSYLLLTNVSAAASGQYSVLLSNVAGTVTSSNATLTVVPPPEIPVIVYHPQGDAFAAGYTYHLTVSAVGQAPLEYQWRHNGVELPGATNRVLTFAAIDATNAGTYEVVVRNDFGSAQSLPTTISITNATGGGYVSFNNYASGQRQPIFDVDGVTRLAGTSYAVQLYAGRSSHSLRPVSLVRYFSTGFLAGFFQGGNVLLPDVPPGATVYVQTRVWEAAAGVSYEDARARGGKFGASPVFTLTAVQHPQVPPLVPTVTFNLRAGQPQFTTGKLSVHERPPGDSVIWKLTGSPGFTYLVEKRTPPHNWSPLLLVTNATGTAYFTDTNAGPQNLNFYRTRLLD